VQRVTLVPLATEELGQTLRRVRLTIVIFESAEPACVFVLGRRTYGRAGDRASRRVLLHGTNEARSKSRQETSGCGPGCFKMLFWMVLHVTRAAAPPACSTWCGSANRASLPAQVIAEFAELLKLYDITEIQGDRYAVGFHQAEWASHGIKFRCRCCWRGAAG
jgi:hypothetical protein